MKTWNCAILNSFFWTNKDAAADSEPDVSFIPMMLRRRFSQLTKMVFYAGYGLIKEGEQVPLILVSKYGEIQRQYNISKKIIDTGEVLPTAFSFSVFNTAIALLGISLKNRASAQAINSLHRQLEAGLIHALSFLENHSEEEKILLLVGEENLPEEYEKIAGEKNIPFLAGILLSLRGNDYTICFSAANDQDDQTVQNHMSAENFEQCKNFIHLIQNDTGVSNCLSLNKLKIYKNE